VALRLVRPSTPSTEVLVCAPVSRYFRLSGTTSLQALRPLGGYTRTPLRVIHFTKMTWWPAGIFSSSIFDSPPN
jgi:hypothetical protein